MDATKLEIDLKFKINLVMGGVDNLGQSILFSVGDIVGIPKYTFIPFNI